MISGEIAFTQDWILDFFLGIAGHKRGNLGSREAFLDTLLPP